MRLPLGQPAHGVAGGVGDGDAVGDGEEVPKVPEERGDDGEGGGAGGGGRAVTAA